MVLFILSLLAGLFVVIDGYAQDVNSGFYFSIGINVNFILLNVINKSV